jgi:hypothetical protein
MSIAKLSQTEVAVQNPRVANPLSVYSELTGDQRLVSKQRPEHTLLWYKPSPKENAKHDWAG